LLISDVDSTLIAIECIDELADYAGLGPEVAAITARAMNGELDFARALDQRAALLAGLPSAVFAELYRDRCQLMPGAATLAATLRARGVTTAMVSGGFAPLVDRLRADLGFDLAIANHLEVRGGRLTGRVCPPIVDGRRKRLVLEQLCRRHGLDRAATMAVGDGANDLAMLDAAGLGVAYRAKPKVALAAPHRIDHGDLTTLLFLLGIPRSAFVAAPVAAPPVMAAAAG
jgi:phosphoserine phosphatase